MIEETTLAQFIIKENLTIGDIIRYVTVDDMPKLYWKIKGVIVGSVRTVDLNNDEQMLDFNMEAKWVVVHKQSDYEQSKTH